jgi:predicted SAM-dependent methyltransferase
MNITSADLASIHARFAEPAARPSPRRFLNIGAGASNISRLPECFRGEGWQEVRLDIDPTVSPDIIGDVCDLSSIPDATFDAIYSSHNLEHLEGFMVPQALSEMRRILHPNGFAIITLPNLERIAKLILEDKLTDVLYNSPAGPITALDMLFGHQRAIANGNHYMAHRTGFTAKHLQSTLSAVGFSEVRVRAGNSYDLWVIALK